MKVPFLDLKAQYESIKDEISNAVRDVLGSCAFAGGPFVERFEKEFAAYCRCERAIGVGSGTEALWLSLLALDIGPGDEVITVPNTFIATAEAVTFCGAEPAFVDIDDRSYTMDPQRLEDYLRNRTRDKKSKSSAYPKAIIPVHLFGQMADMDAVMEIAGRYGLYVVEDACQAHGAEYKGKRAGSFGDLGCFSFYPGKNLGAYGEAGAVTTNDRDLAEKISILRDHGQSAKYRHERIGWNGRMDGLQGAVLSVKLRRLDEWNASRIRIAEEYNTLLHDVERAILPLSGAHVKHVYHLYAIRAARRDSLISTLAERGVFCGIHYPVPIHLTQAYRSLNLPRGSFPVAERCAEEFVSLPMFPELNESQVRYVAEEIVGLLNEGERPKATRARC